MPTNLTLPRYDKLLPKTASIFNGKTLIHAKSKHTSCIGKGKCSVKERKKINESDKSYQERDLSHHRRKSEKLNCLLLYFHAHASCLRDSSDRSRRGNLIWSPSHRVCRLCDYFEYVSLSLGFFFLSALWWHRIQIYSRALVRVTLGFMSASILPHVLD